MSSHYPKTSKNIFYETHAHGFSYNYKRDEIDFDGSAGPKWTAVKLRKKKKIIYKYCSTEI